MACECCRGDAVHCDLPTVHHYTPSSRQAVTSGYLVQNSCCHHTHSPSHTHMSHQHISTLSHCHNCHPFTHRSHSNEEYCHHAHSSLSHHEQKHIPVIASPLHISHTHTPPPRQMQCSGGIYDTSIQFLTPQSHSRPSCQSQRQLLTPPPRNLLPHFHSGITTPTHRLHDYQQLQQSPLSSYAQPLPVSPEHRLPQVEFSSPLGENNMIGSSCFLLVHPTAPRPNSQPDENQHFYPQNAALQVNSLDESVHTSSMTQYQVQDMARQAAQTAPISAFQPVTKSEPPPLPRNMAVPVVVVEKLPTSTLPKREVSATPLITASVGQSSMPEDPPLFDPMIEENKGNPVEEKVLVKSKKSRRKRCRMLDNEHSAGASYTDTDDERSSEMERKRTLRSFKQRQASSVHGDLESESPHLHSRKPTGVITDTESDGTQSEVEGNQPKPPLRKRYGLRSRTRGMTDSEQEEIDSMSSCLLQRKHNSATNTDDSQSEQDGTQSKKKEKTRQQMNCEQGSVLKSGDVAVEGAAPEKMKDVPEDATLSQSSSPSDNGSGKTGGRKVVVLSNWYFKVMVVGSSCVVLLQGTKADDASGMLWHSGPVVERLSSRELATKSGTVYRLEGALDQAALTEVGISDKKITRSFKNGFPKNWLQLIEKHAMGGKEAVSATEDVAAPLEVSNTLDKGGTLKVKSEPEESRTPNLDVSTDFLSSLKRSSRGRTIKPSTFNMSPYLNLSDNVYSYDMHGSFQGISSPVIDLTLCEVLDQQKKMKRLVKKERDNDSMEDCLPRKKRESTPQKSEPRKQTTQAENWETTLAAERNKNTASQKLSGDHSVDSCAAGLVPGAKPRRKRARRLCIPRLPRKSKVETTVIKAETITVYNGGDDQTVEEEMVKDKVEKTKKSVNKSKGKGRGQTQPQPEDEREEEESIPWSGAAVKSLKSIVHAVPAMTPNFWEIVARCLGTGHSARECNNQFMKITTRKKKALREKPTTSVSITNRVGTLERKQKIRDVLQQLDEGYEDDIFDSTPFKKMKKVQVQDLSDEECFDEEGDGAESRPIQTPSEAKRKLGAPSPLTPKLCSYLTTPDLKGGMKRETADRVIRQVQKVKKGMKHPTKTDPPCPLPGKTKPLLFEQRLRSIRTGELTTLHLFEDGDDSSNDSNPFSDQEENYRDIISRLH